MSGKLVIIGGMEESTSGYPAAGCGLRRPIITAGFRATGNKPHEVGSGCKDIGSDNRPHSTTVQLWSGLNSVIADAA